MAKIESLDLHGVRYHEVEDTVTNWLFPKTNQQLPINIITGNSEQMKKIVINILKSNKYHYINVDPINKGYLKVTHYAS